MFMLQRVQILLFFIVTVAISVNYIIYEPLTADEIENRPLNSRIDFTWSNFRSKFSKQP